MILTTIMLTLLIGILCIVGFMIFVFGGGFLLIFGDVLIFALVVYLIVRLFRYFARK